MEGGRGKEERKEGREILRLSDVEEGGRNGAGEAEMRGGRTVGIEGERDGWGEKEGEGMVRGTVIFRIRGKGRARQREREREREIEILRGRMDIEKERD